MSPYRRLVYAGVAMRVEPESGAASACVVSAIAIWFAESKERNPQNRGPNQ